MTDLMFLKGDARHLPIEDESVQCIVTSPPYWGLRKYSGEQEVVWEPEKISPVAVLLCEMEGHLMVRDDREVEIRTGLGLEELGERYRGGGKKQGEIEKFTVHRGECARCGAWVGAFGLEPTIEMYVEHTVEVLREVRRVLRKDGVVFWNLGDSYAASGRGGGGGSFQDGDVGTKIGRDNQRRAPAPGLKPKDLCLIPQRVAIAAQADGWYVRSMIVWCLSGGTWLYVKSKKGEMPMMVRDMARLDPSTVKLWNGEKWTQVLGWNKSARCGDEIELLLRSGERISCTPNHQWPTQRGLVKTLNLVPGDVLEQTRLPQPELPRAASVISKEVAWFLGLYLAEGSRADDTIQIAGNADEISRIDRIRKIAEPFGGSLTFTLAGNGLDIRVYSRVLNAIIDDHIGGRTAHDKGLMVRCWSYSNEWLEFLLSGYLDGDGSLDEPNRRWRIGFTRNYNLERDLRVLSARLGFTLTLNLATATNQDGEFPSFRGEIHWEGSDHRNNKKRAEIMEIRKARCREVYDIGVEDEPNLFALASGILTHNSKKNPMPESVTDRPTNSWEHIIMLTKSENYFWDGEAVREGVTGGAHERGDGINPKAKMAGANSRVYQDRDAKHPSKPKQNPSFSGAISGGLVSSRNMRNVWTFASQSYSEAHFATFPEELPRRCILAATSARGACLQCGAPWERVVRVTGGTIGKSWVDHSADMEEGMGQADGAEIREGLDSYRRETVGWKPGCVCRGQRGKTEPCLVLDTFSGSGTTGLVAVELNRKAVLNDLAYQELAEKRTARVQRKLF